MAEVSNEQQMNNILAGLLVMNIRVDTLISQQARRASDGELADEDVPASMWLAGVNDALKAVLKCMEDPDAGMLDLEEKMGIIRFKTQVCMMEHGQ